MLIGVRPRGALVVKFSEETLWVNAQESNKLDCCRVETYNAKVVEWILWPAWECPEGEQSCHLDNFTTSTPLLETSSTYILSDSVGESSIMAGASPSPLVSSWQLQNQSKTSRILMITLSESYVTSISPTNHIFWIDCDKCGCLVHTTCAFRNNFMSTKYICGGCVWTMDLLLGHFCWW